MDNLITVTGHQDNRKVVPRNKLNFNSACNNYLYSFFAIVDEGVTAADIL